MNMGNFGGCFSSENSDPTRRAAVADSFREHDRNATLLLPVDDSDMFSYYQSDNVTYAIQGNCEWIDPNAEKMAQELGDAHALMHVYRSLGTTFLDSLKGSFALAIIDKSQQQTLLSTDRLGLVPMCYGVTLDQELVFGTSIGLVGTHPRIKTELDAQAIYNYMYFHVIPSPDTIYTQIKKLQPAQLLIYRKGVPKLQNYWQPQFVNVSSSNTHALSQTLRSTLECAVKKCTTNSSRTGAFLSGGLDSSTVAGMLARVSTGKATAFSIGFDEPGYDEMEYAAISAKHFGLDHKQYYVTPDDVSDALPIISSAFDEPFGNSSAIPSLFCARLAKQNGFETLLAGDGGDELFAGNERYAKQKLFMPYASAPPWLRHRIIEPIMNNLGPVARITPINKLVSYVKQARIPMPQRMYSYNFLDRTSPTDVFDDSFLGTIDANYPSELLSSVYDSCNSHSTMDRMLYLDWKFTLADNDIPKVSTMCKAAGINVRYPMLDDDVVALSVSVPRRLKLKGLQLRYFYKFAFAEFLAKETINKPKHGFGLPIGAWLKSSPKLREQISESLSDLKKRHIFQAGFIDKLVRAHHDEHAAYYGTIIWVLAMLENWLAQNT